MTNDKNSSAQELLHRRKMLFENTARQCNKDRVPILSNTRQYPFYDAGYTTSEALSDYDKIFSSLCRFHEKYQFDAYWDLGSRFPYKAIQELGKTLYIWDDFGIQYLDSCFMGDDEYPVYAEKGQIKYFYENIIPRRFELTKENKEDFFDRMVRAAKANDELNEFVEKVAKYFKETYGIARCIIKTPFGCNMPLGGMMQVTRGMKNLSIDLRRRKAEVDALMAVLEGDAFERFKKNVGLVEDRDDLIFPWQLTALVHTLLNKKQFDEYCWPYIKKYTDVLVENDQIGIMLMEGQTKPYIDDFKDLEKGHFILYPEQDDLAELKKLAPNLSYCGGMQNTLVGMSTKEKCIDRAKELIDTVGYDGAYVFCIDKMLAFKSDVNPDNLLAVNDFVREYGVYK